MNSKRLILSKKDSLTRSIAPIAVAGVTCRVSSLKEFSGLQKSEAGNLTYGRYLNYSLTEAEKKLEKILNSERAVLCASGMAAITSTLFTLVQDRKTQIIYSRQSYRKTDQLINNVFARQLEIPVHEASPEIFNGKFDDIVETIALKPTTIIFLETPTNPLLKLIDIRKLSSQIKKYKRRGFKIITIIDSTMATPYLLNPRKLGGDIEIHSLTKYLGGHDDMFAGVVAGPKKLIEPVCEMRSLLGGINSPPDLVQLQIRFDTFDIRMKEISKIGLHIAQLLHKHQRVAKVYYPGLKASPYCQLAKQWTKSVGKKHPDGEDIPFGSVVSFEIKSKKIKGFANKFGLLGVNFGGTHTVLDPLGYRMTPKFRKQLGINERLFRLSVGLDLKEEEITSRLLKALET